MMKNLVNLLSKTDRIIIETLQKISAPLARGALFVVFFWFGILKIFIVSPANPLIEALQKQALPFMSFHSFIVLFGLYEMIIGVLFLVPHLERVAIAFLIPHLMTTILPLIFLPALTWQNFLVPTLEGQYIIKNLVIVALAFSIAAHLHPIKKRWW